MKLLQIEQKENSKGCVERESTHASANKTRQEMGEENLLGAVDALDAGRHDAGLRNGKCRNDENGDE